MNLLDRIVPLGIPLAWLNLLQEKKRFGAAVAGIMFAVILMLFQLGLNSALFAQVVAPHYLIDGDVVMHNPQYEYFGISRSFNRRRLTQALALPDVSHAMPLYLITLPLKHPETGTGRDILNIGFDPADPLWNDPTIQTHQATLKLPGRVLFDVRSREAFGPFPQLLENEPMVVSEINGRRVEVAGSFVMGTTFAADGNLLMSVETFHDVFPAGRPAEVGLGVLKLVPGADPATVVEALRQRLPEDVRVMTMADFIAAEKTYWGQRTPIGFVITASMIVALIVGAVIVYQILYTDVTDHLEEYATLKSIGFRDRYFVGLILQESVILSVMGFLPGIGLTAFLYALTRKYAYMPTYLSWEKAGIVLGLTLLMCLTAGLLATRKLRAAEPADLF